MLDALSGAKASSKLIATAALHAGRLRHPQPADRRNPPAPCLTVVCGKSKGKRKASKPVRPAQPAPQVLPCLLAVPQASWLCREPCTGIPLPGWCRADSVDSLAYCANGL